MAAVAPPLRQAFIASDLKEIARGNLVASFTLTLPSGLVLYRCLVFEKEGRSWIGLPSNEWTDAHGEKHYSKLFDFVSSEAKAKFFRQAEEALKALRGESRDWE